MANITIPKGASVYLPFTVLAADGITVDTTTVVPAGAIGSLGEVAAQLVTSDGPTTRRMRVDGLSSGQIGVGRGDVSVTARNRTAHQGVDLSAPPDFSAVSFGAPSTSFQTPQASDPIQFP